LHPKPKLRTKFLLNELESLNILYFYWLKVRTKEPIRFWIIYFLHGKQSHLKQTFQFNMLLKPKQVLKSSLFSKKSWKSDLRSGFSYFPEISRVIGEETHLISNPWKIKTGQPTIEKELLVYPEKSTYSHQEIIMHDDSLEIIFKFVLHFPLEDSLRVFVFVSITYI